MADSGAAIPTGPAADNSGRRGRGRGNNRSGRGRGRGDGTGGSRGGNRGRGRGGNNANAAVQEENGVDGHNPSAGAKEALSRPSQPKPKKENGEDQDTDADGEEVCFICANPIQHHSVAPCNHITCHICSLRLRALYKRKDCPHCRTAAPFVIFTDDASKRFEEYIDSDITSSDENIGIRYTNEDIVGDTVLLLRYNCPDASCDFAGLGWPDLHRHVRSAHQKKMCDLCTRNKKDFTHEHELFTDKALHKHMAHGDDKPGAIAQTGFKGHPLCGFCGERFYDDDKLYEHCRNKHERCFICDRRDSRTPHYYLNYNALEEHFKNDHYLCSDRECLEKKFVVFDTEMDLKAHQLSEHGSSLSKDVRRDARVVDIAGFDYRQPYQEERRGGRSGGGRGGREGRGRGRDPNAEPLPRTAAQPLRRDEIAFQRQMAIHSAQSVSNRTFGGQLTTTSNSSSSTPATRPQNGAASSSTASQQTQPVADAFSSPTVVDPASMTPQEHARYVRHRDVIERASNLLGNDAAKMSTFRADISSYKSGSLTGAQLIDAFFALFTDTSANALGTLVREVADLFEDKSKADGLRKAWQDWRAINEDYPSLPGLGGMHGATTSSSGWASAAASGPTLHRGTGAAAAAKEKHTTRVLKLKNSTRRGAGVPGSTPATAGPSSIQWAASPSSSSRSTPAPSSSSAFPALPTASSGGGKTKTTPMWIGGTQPLTAAAAGGGSSSGTSTPVVRRTAAGSAPVKNEEAFPSLPAAPKLQTTIFGYGRGAVRRDFGQSRETGFSWGGGKGAEEAAAAAPEPEAGASGTSGKGKKKKGKQVLAAWG